MKKNRMMRAASALLVAVLLTTCTISGTFAKYVSTATGSDSARVALWDIKLEGNKMGLTNVFAFDLFNTVYDTLNGAEEGDVKVGSGETIIAPGTKGGFQIDLKNDSEVNAQYKVQFNVTNAGVPLTFKVNGVPCPDNKINTVEFTALNMGNSATITVEWEWAFTTDAAGDTYDTTLGLAGEARPVVEAIVTVEQVD